MVFSKELPKEVDSEVGSMTVYKVVRLIGDELYSPYYHNDFTIKREDNFPNWNGFTFKVAAPIIKDVEKNIAKTTDLPFVQYSIEQENFLYSNPSKIAIIDKLNIKRNIKFVDFETNAYKLLTPTNVVGMYGYTRGFVFSYIDYNMAVNSIEHLKQLKLKANIYSNEYYTKYTPLKTLGYLQPEEYQYAIIECSIPLTYVLNKTTYKNTYVKTVEGTSTIATKFLKLENILKVYPPIKFEGNNIKIVLKFTPPVFFSGRKIRIVFDGFNGKTNKPDLSSYYIDGIYDFDNVTKTLTIKSIKTKNVTYDDNGVDLIAENMGEDNYGLVFKNIKLNNTPSEKMPFDVSKIHVFYDISGLWKSKSHKIEYF